ncbi:MAG TPA: riboflavin synthase, partial [Propionibacteriaceae bacterium]|nr:riboflavin synthase [Propionibacteriaceae bacterium]
MSVVFTGIVQEIGALRGSRPAASAASADIARLDFSASQVLEGAHVGDSISVNGCCLTVVELGLGWWAADAV